MRSIILNFLRVHPRILNLFWRIAHILFMLIGLFVPLKANTMLITAFAGRKYDDSPKALYEEVIKRNEFRGWDIIWAFVDPDQFEIPVGRKIRIDTWSFFMALLYSRVWISNSGMDRNICINRKGTIKIETWHGTPLKKIGIDQNSGVLGNFKPNKKIDTTTIRCSQSEFDRDIFVRVFNADKNCILLSDLPRNDELLCFKDEDIIKIKKNLKIDNNKKVLLYMPTYREYLVNKNNQTFIAPPINLEKWKDELGNNYVLLFRAHYAVNAALNLVETEFVRDVSDYPYINELYAVSDILISDYSSAYFDFSILDKPMLCFAYDKEEYEERRGLYLDLEENLPCAISKVETDIIREINTMDYKKSCEKSREFHRKFAPYAGNASKAVVDELIERLRK
ncbi:CDP-glycerol glycerophosphotransferase [Lachnospiraceae bacterium RM5]|nr:CDP-glycerol glycerophosphotransferase [Lachnospiraceae bacterium RM5]